jgi:hypothetical protein
MRQLQTTLKHQTRQLYASSSNNNLLTSLPLDLASSLPLFIFMVYEKTTWMNGHWTNEARTSERQKEGKMALKQKMVKKKSLVSDE